MEYIDEGTWLQQGHNNPYSPGEAMTMLLQILSALEYLHGLKIAHRDVTPSNILVKSRNPLITKLSDFGISRQNTLKTCCGTKRYAAPEIYSKSTYSLEVDIWSLGMVLLQYSCE